MDRTNIEWTDATWNPGTGCTKVSPGCDHCYAETLAERFRGTPGHYYERGFDVQLRPEKLDQPLRWRRPRRIFVNSMSDLFHDDIPDEYIARVFAIMALAGQHTFQLLTKRHGRMRSLLNSDAFLELFGEALYTTEHPTGEETAEPVSSWPLPNVWLGVSVETQQWADIRIPALLDTPAAVRFLSCEPLLGPVNLGYIPNGLRMDGGPRRDSALAQACPDCLGFGGWPCHADGPHFVKRDGGIDWVIVGGESGRGARPMHPEWARSLLDQCQAAGVPFLFKQWGDWGHAEGEQRDGDLKLHPLDGDTRFYYLMRRVGKKAAGRLLGGRTWDEYPQAVTP